MISGRTRGQDAVKALQQANANVRTYYEQGVNIMYAIGALVGLIGAIKVYQKWTSGHPDTGSVAAAWFGGALFLVVTATVIKLFFGIA